MKIRTLILILSIGLILFWIVEGFWSVIVQPEFYTNAALIIGVAGVVYFFFSGLAGKEGRG